MPTGKPQSRGGGGVSEPVSFPKLSSPGCPALQWLPSWKLRWTPELCPWGCPRQDEQESVCTREGGGLGGRGSLGAMGTWWREGCWGLDIRGSFGRAGGGGAHGSEMEGGVAGAVGKGQQRLPVQGRVSSEDLLEWAPGPGSKLGQIWDFLWNFPFSPPCPPSFIFQPIRGPSHP